LNFLLNSNAFLGDNASTANAVDNSLKKVNVFSHIGNITKR